MRIVCPNCDAQYEVPDEVIPEDGRDVQCSNCNQTWFQKHPDQPDADEDTAAEAVLKEPEVEPVEAETPPTARKEDVAREDLWEDDPFADEEFEDEFEEDLSQEATLAGTAFGDYDVSAGDAPIDSMDDFSDKTTSDDLARDVETVADTTEPTGPTRKELDPEVEEILRTEAARENEARAAEKSSQNLEMQQELGLDNSFADIAADEREKSARMARMRGEDDSEDKPSDMGATAAVSALSSRRDMLPDIEEINSTLRSTGDRDVAGDDPDPEAPIRNRKRRGFRRGFLWAVVLFLIAVLIYVFSPQIAEAVPALDPALSAYVMWIDSLRGALDTQMQSVLKWLDAKAAATDG